MTIRGEGTAVVRGVTPQEVFDFVLDDDEMRRIAALVRRDGRIADPAGRAPAWD